MQELRSLRSDAGARSRAKLMVLFGRTLVEEFVAHGGSCLQIYADPQCQLNLHHRRATAATTGAVHQQQQPTPVSISHSELEWASGVVCGAEDSCAAVVVLPSLGRAPDPECPRVLVLDGVSDPGNLGSLVRSAAAFDFRLVLLQPNSGASGGVSVGGGGPQAQAGCDPFNDKVVRSSMGAVMQTDMFRCDEAKLRAIIADYSKMQQQPPLRVLVSDVAAAGSLPLSALSLAPATPASAPSAATVAVGSAAAAAGAVVAPVWLVVGNEAHGVRSSLRDLGQRVHVPMGPRVESLNAAVAGAILMQNIHAQHSASSSSSSSSGCK